MARCVVHFQGINSGSFDDGLLDLAVPPPQLNAELGYPCTQDYSTVSISEEAINQIRQYDTVAAYVRLAKASGEVF